MRKLIHLGLFLTGFLMATALTHSFALAAPQALPMEAPVQVKDNHLQIDGKPQPQLFGAELQYFRLRGGYGKNVPREKVIALWNQALDRMVEAKMNTISFYIPWDFHEYADGKFDFDGTADEDHDGRPDYPSRDLKTFFKLIENHGIHRIMVRPGPYINAEWGFLGFGAIPEWFHDRYPESHMKTSWGWSTRLYDYHNPDLLKRTQLWFQTLHNQVLKDHIGPGKPIIFVQLDNETNYQWQSIYNHDYGPGSVARYQEFLKGQYKSLPALNQAHNRQWSDWTQVRPPVQPQKNLAEDQDWYRFSDVSIYTYLSKIRKLWENLGVKEPQVLFTLAESYNAVDNGILPNFIYRNARGLTGMMTVNLYPKTDESQHAFLNLPFKSDLDVKSADAANDSYFGSKQQWVLGPEIQAGWWRDTTVLPSARLQTYLSVIGHGLKAFYVYYFNEGQNWDVDWAYRKTLPILQALRKELKVENIPLKDLSNEFWGEMQARSDRLVLVGLDVRKILQRDPLENQDLYFDAPLDGDAKPRSHFYQLKLLGEKLLTPYGDFLARSLELQDRVAIVKDDETHVPSKLPQLSNLSASSDWAGGLLGYLLTADINPKILHGDLSLPEDFHDNMLFHIDTGMNSPRTLQLLQQAWSQGQTIVNTGTSALVEALGVHVPETSRAASGVTTYTYYLDSRGALVSGPQPDAKAVHFQAAAPLFSYSLAPAESAPKGECQALLYVADQVVGYQCQRGQSHLVQLGTVFFSAYNSGTFGDFTDVTEQRNFLKALLQQSRVVSALSWAEAAPYAVAFARQDPAKEILYVTVKTGANSPSEHRLKVDAKVLADFLRASARYVLREPLAGTTRTVSRQELVDAGFLVKLAAKESKVYILQTAP